MAFNPNSPNTLTYGAYGDAAATPSMTRQGGTAPWQAQGATDPAAALQRNRHERNYWSDRLFSLQAQRMLRGCPNGKGCKKHLNVGAGGAHVPQGVNATFLGSQTDVDVLMNRPDFHATVVEGQMRLNSALELVSHEAFDKSVDGGDWFCKFSLDGKNVGYCDAPAPNSGTPNGQLRLPTQKGFVNVGEEMDQRNVFLGHEKTYAPLH